MRELIGRVRRAGATGPLFLRADSGFWSKHVIAACRDHGVGYSITVRQHQAIKTAIGTIDDDAWTPIDYTASGDDHCPSGRFHANGAWAVFATVAHNLLRWVHLIGTTTVGPVVAKTIRRRLLALPGRLTRGGRQRRLHLPARWPWATEFGAILERLRAVQLRV